MNASEFSSVSTKQQRIAQLAKQSPRMAFTSLAHLMDVEWLKEAYRRTKKGGAPGVDGVTSKAYEAHLEDNLRVLLEKVKSGRYYAPPVKRAYIPKGRDELRPIGIPTLEDKILQRAVCMLLEPIYEQDFHPCSYGFRPNRSAHQAIAATWNNTMRVGGGWIVDMDIRQYFDTIDHRHLQAMLRQRVNDGVILRLVGKWLNAGVQEQGSVTYPDTGSPQGGVISPLLSNLYLHYVMDEWFATTVTARMRGQVFMTRFADDVLMGFSLKADALRVMRVLSKRFAKFGLTLHPEKTRLVAFNRPRRSDPKPDPGNGTFDFLGFTHYWAKSRNGNWIIKRKTASGRLRAKLQGIAQWCRHNRHRPFRVQHKVLSVKLQGHYRYYGVRGNDFSLSNFRYAVHRIWLKWLNRRSRKGKRNWDSFNTFLRQLPLPAPRIIHSDI